ncbi:hypothetical protein GCM10025780_26130 [Frondihabitans cladoniiphilus]|uniref:Uncharacterized protein n=1 Tax=Frondihabitans cladoniiphilus TaxID=715785 RepID=A0ABP8W3N2_9MICO
MGAKTNPRHRWTPFSSMGPARDGGSAALGSQRYRRSSSPKDRTAKSIERSMASARMPGL